MYSIYGEAVTELRLVSAFHLVWAFLHKKARLYSDLSALFFYYTVKTVPHLKTENEEISGTEGEGDGEKTIPDLKTQNEELHALLNQRLVKGDIW